MSGPFHSIFELRNSGNTPEQLYKIFQYVIYVGQEERTVVKREPMVERRGEILAGDTCSDKSFVQVLLRFFEHDFCINC